MLLSGHTSQAGSATWDLNPATGDWNHAANWTPAAIPNSSSDTATFASSSKTGVSLSAPIGVNGIVFDSGASAFTITLNSTALTISGAGITNNSAIDQNFVAAADGNSGVVFFSQSATAGSRIVYTSFPGGGTEFENTSNAGKGIFLNKGGVVSGAQGGVTFFFDSASAGNGTFTNKGGEVSGANGGVTEMGGTEFRPPAPTAANGTFTNEGGAVSGANGGKTILTGGRGGAATGADATFINNGGAVSGAGGGVTLITGLANGGNATLIANGGSDGGAGGSIQFAVRTRGGSGSRVEVFGNGNLDISGHLFAGITIGSVEGDGDVFLGARPLSVGRNNLSTAFSGVIQDGGTRGGAGGSLTKVGKGKLNLMHANTYTGGTTIERGTLTVNNDSGSGTGSGPVRVTGGTLGGKGIMGGAVTVGTGNGSGAFLAPGYQHGADKLGPLTIESPLTFNSDSTYEVELNSSSGIADKVVADGVTINSGAQFSFADLGGGTLTAGTVFIVINNAAATPIAGTFSNLADGSTFSSNGNSFTVNYEGGDGTDLTLTVVP